MENQRPYWKSTPVKARIIALLGVFFLFSTIGFSIDVMQLGRQRHAALIISVALNGLFAMSYAVAGTVLSKFRWPAMVVIFLIQNVVMSLIYVALPVPPLPAAMNAADIARMQHRLTFSACANIAAMVLGYSCFVVVLITEGRRYFRAHAEIELASEIHRTLVPNIDTAVGDFEFYGRSVPSGEVGGDLIDLFHDSHGWIAYVADVSGHGVAPGVVMGMVKSAARMRLTCDGTAGLLESLNSVLYSVTKPEMFVTFAYVASVEGRLECAYSLAGHPAILHYRAKTREFSEVTCSNLPLGMFDGQRYATSVVEWFPGDLFLLLTDGVLEIENAKGEEFGLDGVKRIVLQHADDPAKAIFQALLDAAHHHGRASDDQSVLIMRSPARPAPA
ncbi:MAG TPA: PP2C family protein-serine/threonine phosphatase [Terracidiphilus sp.]|nr:PP2C family protein-serine/threonine phosphatase [Terracidiphilus sp.]